MNAIPAVEFDGNHRSLVVGYGGTLRHEVAVSSARPVIRSGAAPATPRVRPRKLGRPIDVVPVSPEET